MSDSDNESRVSDAELDSLLDELSSSFELESDQDDPMDGSSDGDEAELTDDSSLESSPAQSAAALVPAPFPWEFDGDVIFVDGPTLVRYPHEMTREVIYVATYSEASRALPPSNIIYGYDDRVDSEPSSPASTVSTWPRGEDSGVSCDEAADLMVVQQAEQHVDDHAYNVRIKCLRAGSSGSDVDALQLR